MECNIKWYSVKIPVVEGGALDQRIQALCQDGGADRAENIVQMAAVTGIVEHMHRNLGLLERELQRT